MYRDVTPLLAIDEEQAEAATVEQAVAAIADGKVAIVATDDAAHKTLVGLGTPDDYASWLVARAGGQGWIRLEGGEMIIGGPADEMARLSEFKYDPNQPRVPAGQTGGGRWTSTGGSGVSGGSVDLREVGATQFEPSVANSLGARVPLPTLDELRGYDPVPGTDTNENMLLRHVDEEGQLSAERRAIHDELVFETLSDEDGFLYPTQPEGERTAVMMGGGPAAGKSTAINLGYVQVPNESANINPDEFKIMLPETKGPSKSGKQGNGTADEFETEWASIVHEESSLLGKRAIAGAIDRGMNMVIDKVQSNGRKAVAQIRELQDNGYRVEAAFVTTDIDQAVDAARQRGQDKGRYVGDTVVRAGHVGANQAYLDVVTQTDVAATLLTTYPRNADGSYNDPVLTATGNGRGGLIVHDRGAWDEYVTRLPDPTVVDGLDLTFE